MANVLGAGVENLIIKDMASSDDARAFKRINQEYLTDISQMTLQDLEILDQPETTIVRRGGFVLIARLDNKVVGCAALVPAGKSFELCRFAVDREFRDQGIGLQLLTHIIARAREQSAAEVFLVTRKELSTALHLYEKLGFEHVAPESLPKVDPRANVWMSRQLSPLAS